MSLKSEKPMVEVLLATYNGERFLAEQIESILAQDYECVRLVVRDDGSSDGSVAIVRSFVEMYPDRVTLVSDSMGNLGSAMNFFQLLCFSQSDYVMFSDQDDVWLPEKVDVTLTAMRDAETRYGKHVPVLAHTDLVVVDWDLLPVAGSFWAYQNLDPRHDGINRLLVQNVVTGCTVMVNRSLMALVRPAADGMIEHDWWLALLAAAFGRIAYVSRQTILYRQHGHNVLGAVRWNPGEAFRKFLSGGSRKLFIMNLEKTRIQATRFLKTYESLLTRDVAIKIRCYAFLGQLNIFFRLVCVFRYRFFKIGIKRNVGMLLSLILTSKSEKVSGAD